MGLLEKLKNTFFEEEYIEVEEKPKVKKEVKKEPKKFDIKKRVEEKARVVKEDVSKPQEKSVVPEEEIKEEKKEVVPKEPQRVKREETLEEKTFQRETNFGYFDDADFLDITEELYPEPVKPKKEVKKTLTPPKAYDNPSYGTSSSTSYGTKETKTGFKPTPIISPIYGILDKNYTKEEVAPVREVKPSSYVSRKNADLDSVREKAFGSLTSDFGLVSFDEKEKVVQPETSVETETDDHLLYDMTEEDKTPTVDKVTLQDAEEYFQDLGLEYNIDYKDAKLEKATGRRVSKTPKLDDIEETENEENSSLKEESESSLEDNLFDLIDSMYEEKE